jgi:glycosyltransferase involved in cell wall biosynthesis
MYEAPFFCRDYALKVLMAHNSYQHPGGEDIVFRDETQLLRQSGHEVIEYLEDNHRIGDLNKVRLGIETVWSASSYAKLSSVMREFRPHVVHLHNTFPLISPSAYYAARKQGAAIVQTLHNFRLICPNALLFREGMPCEQCVGRSVAWPGIVNACYRNSHSGTAVLAAMLATHRLLGTWTRGVDAYIALSEFAKGKLVAGGVPSSRLFVKPNCLTPDPGARKKLDNFALFVGRLSPEKGVKTLLAAWTRVQGRKLKIVGDGPLRDVVEKAADLNIEFLGRQPSEAVLELIGGAAFVILPSECYENFPRVIVEAFARGVPVLGSCVGSVEELIDNGRTGMLFQSGNVQDLANKAEWLFTHADTLRDMSDAARREFETKYTADQNYDQLMKVYYSAIEVSRQRLAPSGQQATSVEVSE